MTTAADRSSWLDLRQGRFLQERQEGVAAVPYSPPDSLRNRFVEEAMSPQTTTMPKAFDFSAFFSSPGLSALRSQQQSSSTHIKPTEQWIGFTHLPTADEFRNLLYRHELLSRAADHSPRVNQYLTPARPPSRSTSRSTSATPGISTTAKKRRPVTDLEAFNEVLEYGVLSVKRRQTPSSPDLFSNEKPKSADRTLTPSFLHLPGPAPVNDSVSSNPLRSFSLSVSESPPQQDTAKQRQRLERSDDLEPGSTAVSSEEERRRQADPMRPPPSLEELQQRQNRLLENCDDLESTYRRLLSLAGRN